MSNACRITVASALLFVCVLSSGCSMKWWGGDMAGTSPGVHLYGGSIFERPEISVTSDCNASIALMEANGPPDPCGHPGWAIKLQDAKFGQDASSVLKEIPAVMPGLYNLQESQKDYAQVWATMIDDVAVAAISAFGPVAQLGQLAKMQKTSSGINLTLPNGTVIGGQKISGTDDLAAIFAQAQTAMNELHRLRTEAASIKAAASKSPATQPTATVSSSASVTETTTTIPVQSPPDNKEPNAPQ